MSRGTDKAEILGRLRAIGAEYKRTRDQLEEINKRRDEAIILASEAGLSRREVARSAGLTAGRVQQIIERDAPAARATPGDPTPGDKS